MSTLKNDTCIYWKRGYVFLDCSISWLLQPNNASRVFVVVTRRRCFHSIRASMQEKHALISQLEEFEVGKAECRMQEDKERGDKESETWKLPSLRLR